MGWVGDNQLVLKTAVVCTGDERKREKSGVMLQDKGQVGPKDVGREAGYTRSGEGRRCAAQSEES